MKDKISIKEKVLNSFQKELELRIISFFESRTEFNGKFILNSKVTKNSSFSNDEFCSIYNFDSNTLPLLDLVLGDASSIKLGLDVKVASNIRPLKNGETLNVWSQNIFRITVVTDLQFDFNTKTIEIQKIQIF